MTEQRRWKDDRMEAMEDEIARLRADLVLLRHAAQMVIAAKPDTFPTRCWRQVAVLHSALDRQRAQIPYDEENHE